MRKYKKILIIIAASLLFLVTAAISLSIIYEDTITNYLVSTLNKKIEAEIKAKKINFSLIEKFPFASIRLDSMLIVSKDKKFPTLYSAKTTFLEFNILNMISGNYSIRNIDIRKGQITIFTEKGKGNYQLVKDSGKEEKFSFALRNVRLSDVTVTLDNRDNNFLFKAFLNTAAAKGKFSESEYNLVADINGKVKTAKKEDLTFLAGKRFDLKSELLVKSKAYSIKNCELSLQDLNFTVEGDIRENKEIETNLKITGKDIAIMDLYKLLPERLITSEMNDYESEGNLDFSATVLGPVSSAELRADYKIRNGRLIYKPEDLELKNINLSGNISNGKEHTLKTVMLQLSDFNADTKQGSVAGSLTVTNFVHPVLNMNVKARTSLEQIMPFVKQNIISGAKGNLEIQAHYNGPLKKASSAKDLAAIRSGGMVKLKKVSLSIEKENIHIRDLDGNLVLDKNDLMITTLGLDFNGTWLNVKGRFDNLIPALFSKDEHLQAYLDMSSDNADLQAFLPEKSGEGGGGSFAFPFSAGRMNMNFEKAKYKRFEATGVTGTFSLQGESLKAENLNFSTMGGKVNFEGSAEFMKKGIAVKGRADIKSINISSLFYVFNNFGQNALTNQQIKGEAEAEINFQCQWNHNFEFDPASLFALCELSVEKGQLLNFEPLYHLSNYISLTELKDIRFSKLQNSFIIRDSRIIFPEMVINSNALNLTCSGTHFFSNKVDYHFELSLNEFLWNKAKTAKPLNEEFGIEEDDDLGKIRLHLSMTGDVDNPSFSYDRKSFRKSLQEEARQEKLKVKGLLKQDLGLFKADTTVKAPEKKKEKPLQIDWDETDKKDNKKQPEKTPEKEKEKGKVGKFIDKIAKPGGEEKSGDNSDDFN